VRRETRTRRGADERRPGPLTALKSPRDAGVSVRSRRTSRRRSRPVGLAVLVAIGLLVTATGSRALLAPEGNASTRVHVAAVWRATAAPTSTLTPDAVAASKPTTPTPAFASYRGVRLHLPVAVSRLTVLAFHASSYNDTVPMKTLVREGSPSAAKKAAEKARYLAKHPEDDDAEPVEIGEEARPDGVWTGSALHLWRTGRQGKTDTAIDCGAEPGSSVYALVDGTVMQVRPYKLYGKYSDYEIDIKPDGLDDIYVVVLHVTDPAVVEGQRVVGGLTRLAKVRDLASVVSGLQLRTYSADGGNHTHIQLNKLPKPSETWEVGSDPPGLVRKSS